MTLNITVSAIKPFVLDNNVTFRPLISTSRGFKVRYSFMKPGEGDEEKALIILDRSDMDLLLSRSWPPFGVLNDDMSVMKDLGYGIFYASKQEMDKNEDEKSVHLSHEGTRIELTKKAWETLKKIMSLIEY